MQTSRKNMLQNNSIDMTPILELLHSNVNSNFIVETLRVEHDPDEDVSLATIGQAEQASNPNPYAAAVTQMFNPDGTPVVEPETGTLRVYFTVRPIQPNVPLEELVNLAGETSIFRGRIEQQVSDVGHLLEDVESTIERVRDQLRRLDMETQAQILSRHQDEVGAGYEDFDPLEMDQYSELHQITKQLSESASDLLDLKNTLLDRTRDTETLLLQQQRINTDLQEKLMRTRMVPFSRLVPRLRRIVRQVSGEVGKRVAFDVINPEGELDRTLMERVVAPLEHMLRNAVDHGIEDPEQRDAMLDYYLNALGL